MTFGKISIWYSKGYGLRYGWWYYLKRDIGTWTHKKIFTTFNPAECAGMIKWGFIFMCKVVVIRWAK